jgi:L,D-peptidoglycan transpeptidase YkuD (ErfK/YbiS/YcfS/YnhG family)
MNSASPPLPNRLLHRLLWGMGMLVMFCLLFWQVRPRGGDLPTSLGSFLAADCRQVVLVRADAVDSFRGIVWLLERDGTSGHWKTVDGPFPASLGRNGIAWGLGETHAALNSAWGNKQEGDGKSPAGIFRIPFVFGSAEKAEGVRLPYRLCRASLKGVDDPKSRYYNQVIESASIQDQDWQSAEEMLRADGLYEWGAMIAQNPDNIPGAGSCLFLHRWKDANTGTSGCVALAREHVLKVIQWLDPAAEPRLILDAAE